MLASRLADKYRYENCAVVALDDGGAIIGAEISGRLHCALSITISQEIDLPREPWAVGGIAPDGQFVYNPQYSKADLDEIADENRGFIEEQKINKFHDINDIIGEAGIVDRDALDGQNIILTSEGLADSFKLDLIMTFLKTVKYEKIIVATPIASVKVVDWMHVHADDIYCLSVVEEFTDTNHYYDLQDVPDHETILKIVNQNILNWQ
jgi:predicted phosphoribosyltransferase